MFAGREDFDGSAGVFFRFLDNGVRKLFLNAAASSGVADFRFFGRGAWIDQPSVFNASQPRCGQAFSSPSSFAIQAAIFGLVHSPPSLEQVPKKLIGFFDPNLLQHTDLARFLIDRMIPSDRKAR